MVTVTKNDEGAVHVLKQTRCSHTISQHETLFISGASHGPRLLSEGHSLRNMTQKLHLQRSQANLTHTSPNFFIANIGQLTVQVLIA